MRAVDRRRVRHEKPRAALDDVVGVVLQLMGLLMVVMQLMGLLLRGTTPQMVLPRVQHAAAQGVQRGQRARTHLRTNDRRPTSDNGQSRHYYIIRFVCVVPHEHEHSRYFTGEFVPVMPFRTLIRYSILVK